MSILPEPSQPRQKSRLRRTVEWLVILTVLLFIVSHSFSRSQYGGVQFSPSAFDAQSTVEQAAAHPTEGSVTTPEQPPPTQPEVPPTVPSPEVPETVPSVTLATEIPDLTDTLTSSAANSSSSSESTPSSAPPPAPDIVVREDGYHPSIFPAVMNGELHWYNDTDTDCSMFASRSAPPDSGTFLFDLPSRGSRSQLVGTASGTIYFWCSEFGPDPYGTLAIIDPNDPGTIGTTTTPSSSVPPPPPPPTSPSPTTPRG